MTHQPTRHVTLVCGPPCSGKTTWVGAHASPDDIVVDHDALARHLGSTRYYTHGPHLRGQAERYVAQLLRHVATMEHGTAWVIRTAPTATHRVRLAHYLRATRTVLLLPPMPELLTRARARPARRETTKAIKVWLARYTPRDGDEVITD